MTNEERATWIKRGIILFLALTVSLGAWFYPKKEKKAEAKAAAAPQHAIEILHFHEPGNPDSEQIAQSLANVEVKYTGQVLVTRLDVKDHAERARAEKVTKAPKVVMMAGTVRACKFQGVWTQPQIERKVEEILRGLKRMGKDWRPEVQGMTPATASNAPPAGAAQP